jgi:hypothetical protein
MTPTRQVYFDITRVWVTYVLFAITLAVFCYGIYRHWRRWQIGRPVDRFDQVSTSMNQNRFRQRLATGGRQYRCRLSLLHDHAGRRRKDRGAGGSCTSTRYRRSLESSNRMSTQIKPTSMEADL